MLNNIISQLNMQDIQDKYAKTVYDFPPLSDSHFIVMTPDNQCKIPQVAIDIYPVQT